MINPTLILNETSAPPVDGKVYGIHSATQGFLRAFLAHSQTTELLFRSSSDAVRSAVRDEVSHYPDSIVLKEAMSVDDIPQCAMFYTLPQVDQFWLRAAVGADRYSICGLHHSLTGREIYHHVRDLVLAPTEPWDAVICTSRAAKQAFERLFECWSDYLSSRGGTLARPRLQLPVIPLGIDTAEFRPRPETSHGGAMLRRRLGVAPQALVVLFLGRLNFSSKAHPLPMLLALERARAELSVEIHLVQAGWYPSDAVEEATLALARAAAPSIRLHHIGTVARQDRIDAFAAADIFMSLSDNIQETFGLTLIEAMACELPVIATDWDGYRDTVVPEATGYLVPTMMAPPGSGSEIGLRHGAAGRPYNRYLVDVSQATSVDVDAVVRAVVALGSNPELRAVMGRAGRFRAERLFGWGTVVRAYQNLWDDLAQCRRSGRTAAPAIPSPLHPDPFAIFGGFASEALGLEARVGLRPGSAHMLRVAVASQTLRAPSDLLMSDHQMNSLIATLDRDGPLTRSELSNVFGDLAGRTTRSLLWLIKVGVIEVVRNGR